MTQHHHLHLHQHNNKSNNNNKGRQRPNLITMDIDNNKTRDSRRPLPFTANAFPKRRHSTIPFRRSSQEGEVELVQETETETVRLKGKRERDREREPSKRRRGSYEEAESVANEHQDGDVFDAGVSRELSSNTASSSAPDSNHRRTFSSTPLPLLPLRPPSISREIIGVTVPRKARSAGAKRTHASPAFGTSEEQSSRSAVAASSPSFSSVSLKKMKLIGSKTRLSEELKLCSSTDEDIDIEIAELLFDLKTSNSSYYSSSQMLEPSTSPSTLPSDGADNKKVEDHSSSALATQFVKVEKLSDDADNGPGHEIGSSEAVKLENDLNSGAGCDIFPDGRSEFFTSETPSKLDVNKHEDFASIRDVPAIPEDKGQRVDKFEIDLMAPPPMMTSPERDNLLMCEDSVKLKDNAERLAKKEKMKEEDKDVAMDELKLDLKPSKHIEEQVRNMEQPIKFTNLKVEKTGESSSVSLSTAVSEGPGNLLAVRYMAPMQNVVKTEKTTVSAMAPQEHMSFVLSEPRAKRCATHHYIARNVFFHQQRTKMNPLLPSAVASGPPPCNTKYNDINCMRSAGSMFVGKKSQKHSSLNQSVAQEKGCAATNDYSLASVRNSALANSIDSTQMKQLVLQQGSQPGSTGNLVHGPAFLFPTGQHQASKTTTAIQAAGVNSTSSAALSNKSHSSPVGALGTSSTLAGVAAATGFSSPNLTANDTPYMTIVPNSGYPFPFSTPLGASAAIKGASPAQPTPILNGPLYTSQMFHPLQHPHSQSLIQPSYLNASTSNGSSSHKQSQGTQINDNSVLTTTPMQLQLLQKQHALLSNPHKHDEIGMVGENSPSIGGTSYSQKNVFGQNFTIPVQPVNFSFRPSGTSDNIVGGNGGNFSDKKQLPQAPKGGDDRMPSQPFAISFAAFNGSAVPSNLNFSSLAQNPMIFQNLPDIASWQGYQAASASHTMQQNIYSVTEGKYGGKSSHQDDEKKASTSGKSSTNVPTTLVFDNSSKNLNFVSPPMNVNWPSHSMTSTSTTSSSPLSSIASNSHQPPLQLFHLQQQHGMLQQLPAMPTQYKASSTNSTIATKHVNSPTVFSQTLNQCKISNQASQSKNTSIVTSATPSLNGFSYEQERVLQGHSQISFVGSYMPALPPQQGQQLLSNTQPFSTNSIVAGTPPNGGGNMKTNSQGSKPVPSLSINTSQKHQTENSSAGSSQKSSPVCGRNVPSILSSFPSHLSELKY